MFGYLKPYTAELKEKHNQEYKQMYCGLCHGLRKNLGILGSCFLSNECTFLLVFLDALMEESEASDVCFRCTVNPIEKKHAKLNPKLLSYVSFVNYHLTLLSFRDHYLDSRFLKRWFFKACYYYLAKRRKYKRQLAAYSEIAERITSACDQLIQLETVAGSSYDDCSRQMGQLLADVVASCPSISAETLSSGVLPLAHHLGMWVYLIDAYDDLEKDDKHGSFNPLRSFLAADENDPIKTCRQLGELMLNLMHIILCSLAKTIHFYRHAEILENIIDCGTSCAAGNAKNRKKRKDKKNGKSKSHDA